MRMAKALTGIRQRSPPCARQYRQPRPDVLAALRTRVLIVVEDRLAGKRLAQLLAAKGYEGVRVVRRAASALFLARQLSPGIAFLDIALADDAYQLANDLRRQCGSRGLRLIALTRLVEQSTREQARVASFERWLVMPVAQNELDAVMYEPDAAS
jgi:DNA-binding response OmpR family regulator